MNFDKLILDLPRQEQEKYLRDSLREQKIDVFIMLSKTLLRSGGMEAQDIYLIFKEEVLNEKKG